MTGRPGLFAASVVVGLGVGPLIVALAPWPAWAAGLLLLAAGVVGVPAARAELARARQLAGGGPEPPGAADLARDGIGSLLSTLLASLAAVHGAWAVAALLGLVVNGSSAVSAPGLQALLGAGQGFLQAGLQGSPLLVAATVVLLACASLLLASRHASRWMLGLLLASGLGALASSLRLSADGVGQLLEPPAAWPASRGDALAWLGPAVLLGLLACGAGAGLVEAATRRLGGASSGSRAGWLLLPALGLLIGVAAAAPAVGQLAGAPLLAPAPAGRQAAMLLAPAALLPSAGWQAAWFVGLLAGSLLGVLVAAQPARLLLEQRLGVPARAASPGVAALVAITAVPCLLVSGVREDLLAAAAALLVLRAACSLLGAWPGRLTGRVARMLALAALLAGGAALAARGLPLPTWPDAALLHNRALSLGLLGALAAFWGALLLLGARRARRVRRPAPASPAGPRTRG